MIINLMIIIGSLAVYVLAEIVRKRRRRERLALGVTGNKKLILLNRFYCNIIR
jgi:hypothetical protein